ncbi:anti-sigma factor domain-containing protein [Neobacillus kokaensis]|uniref:Anti-sigma-I factor RsgI n=1 Tax=Neobacillus kokaensis TaxID=2759023 RepID=A0ABQ3N3H7_9BACI|nr:anti-sigma factor domain-containing protein [Neobacillus kokaensis]GHH98415.1 anti-sigma-I factor RsgI [Neobacillus kokaensis]
MKKGIVMQIDETFLTLLTPDGEFLRAKRLDMPYMIGEEICFYPVTITKTNNLHKRLNHLFRLKPIWVVSLALLVIIGSLFPVLQKDKAYAYMSIDVNPSIELGVNDKMQVIELTGFNEAGKKIISQLSDWKKQDAAELTKTLLLTMKKEGFLENNQHVIFSTVRTDKVEKVAEEKLQKHLNEIKATINSQALELTVLNCTEEELKKAHELGVTAGKYEANNSKKVNVKSTEKKKDKNGPQKQPKKIREISQTNGQYKKQSENPTGINKGTNRQPPFSEKKMAPGQLKKVNGEQEKNFGQTKKVIKLEKNFGQTKKAIKQEKKYGQTKKALNQEKHQKKHPIQSQEKQQKKYPEKDQQKPGNKGKHSHQRNNKVHFQSKNKANQNYYGKNRGYQQKKK